MRGLLFWLVAAGTSAAQGPELHWQLGGPIVETWVEPDPAHAGELIVWTAEAGPRIRRITTATNTTVFEPIVMQQPWDSHALHHVLVTEDLSYGIAVGSNGRGYWALDLASGPGVWKALAQGPSAAQGNLWESFVDASVPGSPYILVAGERDTLVWTDSPFGNYWNPTVTPALPPGGSRDYFSLGFVDPDLLPSGVRIGVAGVRVRDALGAVVYQGVYRTEDGVHWSPAIVVPPPGFGGQLVIWDIDFVPGSTQRGFAVGGAGFGNGPGYAFRTTDAGRTWWPTMPECSGVGKRVQHCARALLKPNAVAPCTGTGANQLVGLEQSDAFFTLYGVAALSDGGAVAVSYGGVTWRFDPLTREWADRLDTSVFETGPLWGVHAGHGLDRVFVSGQYGEIRRSDDGGWNWTQVIGGHKARLLDLSFGDANVGWAVSQRYRILKSSDGGDSWREQRSYRGTPWNAGLESIAARDAQNAVTLGPARTQHPSCDPVVLYTLNGGADCWPEANLPGQPNGHCGERLAAVGCARGALPLFWIVGDDGLFWRSLDGGASWNVMHLAGVPSTFDAMAIAFDGPDRCFVVGRVQTAGRAFEIVGASGPSPTARDVTPTFPVARLEAVATHAGEAYAVGRGGVVLRYDSQLARFSWAPGAYELTPGGLVQATTLDLLGVGMAGDASGYLTLIAGARGTLLAEVSGLGVWSVVQSRTTDAIARVQLLAPDLGWIVGQNKDPIDPSAHTPFGWGDSAVLSWR